MLKRLLATALALALPAVLIAAPAPKKAAARPDWTRTVVATPEGGFRMGNPNAPVKLVEYGSLTCPHCAHFSEQGVPAILPDVKSGRISYEFRNFVRDPVDLAAALLAHCAGASRYFPLTDKIFATQEQWIGKLQALGEADQKAIDALPTDQKMVRFASVTGLDTIAAQNGVPAARVNACLVDEKGLGRLMEVRKIAIEQVKLEGTPTFLLNGQKLAGVYGWEALQPRLAAGK